MAKFSDRFKNAWNAFMNKDPTENYNLPPSQYIQYGGGYTYRPDTVRFSPYKERTIINSILNRMALDATSFTIKHVQQDADGGYLKDINSGLNRRLNLAANKDQTGRAFRQDIYMSMFDEGCVAIVPIDTNINRDTNDIYEILSMRTGKIIEWYPDYVKVRVYNDRTGQKQDMIVPKEKCAIVQNPFYSVMNEPNSTLKRYVRKLNLMDKMDESIGAQKMDMIIQLPYTTKTDRAQRQAEERRKRIEEQLEHSKLGIAYTDGTEKIIQLNRPIENQMPKEIEDTKELLFAELGMTQEILDGTASESVMNNYYTRTIEPIVGAVADELIVKFLSPTAITQHKSIMYFRSPFKLVSVADLANSVDKYTRNEVLTSNEVRQIFGLKPAQDPNANALRNKNISQSSDTVSVDKDGNIIDNGTPKGMEETEAVEETQEIQNGSEMIKESSVDTQSLIDAIMQVSMKELRDG